MELMIVDVVSYPHSAGVVATVTRRQARQALLLAGLLDHVQPVIDAIEDVQQRRLAQIAWDDSLDFKRDDPYLLQISAALDLSAVQLDALFASAAQL